MRRERWNMLRRRVDFEHPPRWLPLVAAVGFASVTAQLWRDRGWVIGAVAICAYGLALVSVFWPTRFHGPKRWWHPLALHLFLVTVGFLVIALITSLPVVTCILLAAAFDAVVSLVSTWARPRCGTPASG